MTYLEQAVTTMADLPAAILAFALSQGWTVADSGLTRPGGGKTFDLSNTVAANGVSRLNVIDRTTPAQLARIQMPRRSGTQTAPILLAPTKLHLFGNTLGDGDEPYIGVVVEFGYNVYRHMFIGNMNKLGSYAGGEIISANSWCEEYNNNTLSIGFQSNPNKYLFSAMHSHQTDVGLSSGGVNVDHADNPQKWRRFDTGTAGFRFIENLLGNETFGGWQDGVNASLASRGLASYAASNILTPINLYCSRAADGVNFRFIPIGSVPGVRLVRMDGIDPGEQIDIAGTRWMVFPEFSRDMRTTSLRTNFYFEYETSYLCGLAYRMD